MQQVHQLGGDGVKYFGVVPILFGGLTVLVYLVLAICFSQGHISLFMCTVGVILV